MIAKLDVYRIFNIVSQNKSFSKAAQELYMTQSAVSQAISKLEKELEIQLFYRTPKGIVLTNEGELLNEHVNSALGIINVAEDKLIEVKGLKTGQLRIGVGDTISRYFLLPYLEEFHLKYPGIKLNILNGTTTEICAFIKSGKADVGICNLPFNDEYLEVIPCKEIQDIFVCGEKYKTITSKPISLESLMKMPLIFLEKKSNSRMVVENFLKKRGLHVSPMFELGSHDLLLEFTRINLGISCVIKEFSKDYLERGDLYEVMLEENIPPRSIGICYLKSVPLSRAAKKFVDSIY
ncbi:LysR family transcriptional regulator [Paenibacillus crassostreae]|uniref:LysR family transcriptional regulator n=1 Tax=Paenibacillus crassostreae TaxID=1763538 RepID=A0A167BC19_9BACL|nr:LysR family transcriptional regulator [Paenibacillus crassostreae]AOZ92980.1 LysR family transcriptional regulator [Paenibacillus crassostreae]OAB71931.1 LysR family transcriptional regulator [Paenibacillus crassostreae]